MSNEIINEKDKYFDEVLSKLIESDKKYFEHLVKDLVESRSIKSIDDLDHFMCNCVANFNLKNLSERQLMVLYQVCEHVFNVGSSLLNKNLN